MRYYAGIRIVYGLSFENEISFFSDYITIESFNSLYSDIVINKVAEMEHVTTTSKTPIYYRQLKSLWLHIEKSDITFFIEKEDDKGDTKEICEADRKILIAKELGPEDLKKKMNFLQTAEKVSVSLGYKRPEPVKEKEAVEEDVVEEIDEVFSINKMMKEVADKKGAANGRKNAKP